MSARRGFLKCLALGAAGMMGWRWPEPHSATDLGLAQRVVQAAGSVAGAGRVTVMAGRSLPQLLATVLGPATTLQQAALFDARQLQQLLAERIQQDYRKGALVRHQGWWLAASEAAILELGRRAAAKDLGQA